ncbi:MAG TPA: tRNA pseudouridine(55) synthase TruB [Geminicoccus sp.]|jgi:tRNA pseudouridine55 synthase|uniref:tRNA pseudouridine(55) synthase TruB n=1 Tax=Geminicoccus sp. TaxID=2024832 RepID=UPI002E363686|nr:tRNA pseudouridine(55) synthase TruB [Geminicoccus sp.]HEX2526251.1 tRNA pseudouridine(55) synthase TruB [Geminicoccus sp.]
MSRRRLKGVPIHGWLCVDKPTGMTSTHVVNVIKRATNAQKVGHGGTLDPLATGVLPIALGDATKTVMYVMDARKGYEFTVKFGEATDTDDSDGVVIAYSDIRPTAEQIEAALPRFRGEIMQRPPIYAAVKIDGERAYDLARRGEEVILEERPIRVDTLDLVEMRDDGSAVLSMTCGKGAYVRSLARDLGEALGTRAHVTQLRRIMVGPFKIEDSVRLADLEAIIADESLPQVLVPVTTALAGIPALAVTEPQAQRLSAGQPIVALPHMIEGELGAEPMVRAMWGGRLVALTRFEEGELLPVRVFLTTMPMEKRR